MSIYANLIVLNSLKRGVFLGLNLRNRIIISGFQRTSLRVNLSKLNKVSYNRVGFRIFLRKEVIQPQVLLRLPCYDFTPIICPTLDG